MTTIARTPDNVEPRHVTLILAAVHMLHELDRLIGSPEGAFLDLEKGERQITTGDRDAIRRAHVPFATNLNMLLPPLLTPSGDVAPPRMQPRQGIDYPEAVYLGRTVDRLHQVVGHDRVPPTWDRLSREDRKELLNVLTEFLTSLAPIFAEYGVSAR